MDKLSVEVPLMSNKRDWFVLILLSIIWGSSFILIKYSLGYFSSYQIGTLRILISAVAFLPLFVYHFKQIDWSKWKLYLLVGLAGSGIPAFLFPLAQEELSSTVVGILNTMTPFFTLIIGYLFFSTLINTNKIIGVVVGFIGALLLLTFGEKLTMDGNISYGLYVVFASLCYGTSVNVVSATLKSTNSTLLTSVSFMFLIPMAVVMFFITGVGETIMQTPDIWKGLLAVSILSLFGTFLASLLFYKLVQRTNAVFGASVTYLIPIVAAFWGIMDGELFTIWHLVGAGLILFGVYLSRK